MSIDSRERESHTVFDIQVVVQESFGWFLDYYISICPLLLQVKKPECIQIIVGNTNVIKFDPYRSSLDGITLNSILAALHLKSGWYLILLLDFNMH
jgi:hypothetical protein